MSNSLKEIIKEEISKIESNNFALFLSGGMDSLLILLCLSELKKDVSIYTFSREDRDSSDLQRARIFAKYFNYPISTIRIDMSNREVLLNNISILKNKYKAKKKTEIECSYPFLISREFVKDRAILVGHAADGHFCISKKGMIHFRDKIDEFRESYFSNPNVVQNHILKPLFSDVGSTIYFPYLNPKVVEYFKGRSWEEINKPKQKQVIRDQFTGYNLPISLENHTNLQLGDSGIAEGFQVLCEGTRFSNPVAIYNRL